MIKTSAIKHYMTFPEKILGANYTKEAAASAKIGHIMRLCLSTDLMQKFGW